MTDRHPIGSRWIFRSRDIPSLSGLEVVVVANSVGIWPYLVESKNDGTHIVALAFSEELTPLLTGGAA